MPDVSYCQQAPFATTANCVLVTFTIWQEPRGQASLSSLHFGILMIVSYHFVMWSVVIGDVIVIEVSR